MKSIEKISQLNCPSQEELEQYVFEKVEHKIQNNIERHLLNCEMCNDVVDGLKLFQTKEALLQSEAVVNNSVRKLKASNRKEFKKIFAMAASILFLIGISFFAIRKVENKNQMADNRIVSTPPNLNNSEHAINTTTDTVPIVKHLEKPNIEEATQPQPSKIKKTKISVDEKSDNAKSEEEIAELPTIPHNEISTSTSKEFLSVAAKSNTELTVTEDLTSYKAVPKNTETKVPVAIQALSKDENTTQTVSGATQSFDEIRNAKLDGQMGKSSHEKNVFNAGIHYMQKKELDRAVGYFNTILENEKSSFFEDAQWNKAECLKQLGRVEDYKILMQQIIAKNGKFSKQAEEVMRK